MSLTFVSLFSGCGGFDLGFTDEGFSCVGAFDIDENTIATHRRNLRSPAHAVDLSNAPISISVKPTVVIAGPPCQGFSTAGRRDPKDPRNRLLEHSARLATRLDPQAIVIENVAGAIAGSHKRFWNAAIAHLKASGYSLVELRCNANDFGVPQIRKRVIIIAWKGDTRTVVLQQAKAGTLADAIANVEGLSNHTPKLLSTSTYAGKIARRIRADQKLSNVRASPRSVHTWQIPEVFGRTNSHERNVLEALLVRRRQKRLRDFGDADPVSATALANFMGKPVASILRRLIQKQYVRRVGSNYDLAHTFNGKFRRLPLHRPSPTVDTKFGDPYYFLHPLENRAFTVREAARLQGFPDSFLFGGIDRAQFTMVGNAVPPPLGRALSRFIRDHLLVK